MPGYADPAYAESLAEFGAVRRLPRSDGRLLVREIPGGSASDALGPYPLFACTDWSQLDADLGELGDELVSVTLVPDPFGAWGLEDLRRAFPDRCVPFKEHFVVDLSRPPAESASRHHRRDAARAARRAHVELVRDRASFLDEWQMLYERVVQRHGVSGIAAFSRRAFARQLALPDLVAFRAVDAASAGQSLGAALWIVDDAVAFYHLAAATDAGYRAGVSYALVAAALDHFADQGLRWASLGAGAGTSDRADGLTRFKAGWATGRRTAYLCGRVLDRARYTELARGQPSSSTDWFPAYRAGTAG